MNIKFLTPVTNGHTNEAINKGDILDLGCSRNADSVRRGFAIYVNDQGEPVTDEFRDKLLQEQMEADIKARNEAKEILEKSDKPLSEEFKTEFQKAIDEVAEGNINRPSETELMQIYGEEVQIEELHEKVEVEKEPTTPKPEVKKRGRKPKAD